MIEGEPQLQYTVGFDSERFAALKAQRATEEQIGHQQAYIERQLVTDIGERLHRAESHFIYEIKNGKLYGQGEMEPFLDVMGRGVMQRANGTRENAELEGMRFIESYLSQAPEGATVFFPSPSGGVYAENYLDIHRRVGDTVHSVRYLSTKSNEEYREKILEINPAYAQAIPENPKDTDFLLNPVVVPNHLNVNPDVLADFILGGKTGMIEEEFERIKSETAAVRISYALYLAQHPEDIEGLKLMYKAVLAATKKSRDGGYAPKFAHYKAESEYLATQETLGGGGCGSGICSESGASSLARALGLEPDKYGDRGFDCKKCGKPNIRWVKDQLITNCQHCGSDEVLPQNMKQETPQAGFTQIQ